MGRMIDITEEQRKEIVRHYVELKESVYKICADFKLHQIQVEKILKEYGVKRRTYTEAKQEGRKYSCNDDYFKIQSSNMAYILGLLASDGNVSQKENAITIQLLAEDKELLEKIREETDSERPIKYHIRTRTGHEIASFKVWSKAWKDDLAHYGIIPNKTFKLIPPDFLLPEYRIDYIRGYFDGDGSIYTLTNCNRVFVSIVGASRQMIYWIRDELVNHYHIYANQITTETLSTGTVMYKLLVGSIEELEKLYEAFYQNDALYLPRKKEKFQLLLNIPRDSNSSVEE